MMACGVGPEVQDGLLADLRSLRVEYATWRRQFRTGFAGRQRAGVTLSAATVSLRAFESEIVQGLLHRLRTTLGMSSPVTLHSGTTPQTSTRPCGPGCSARNLSTTRTYVFGS